VVKALNFIDTNYKIHLYLNPAIGWLIKLNKPY
jgi:hypothetical protein